MKNFFIKAAEFFYNPKGKPSMSKLLLFFVTLNTVAVWSFVVVWYLVALKWDKPLPDIPTNVLLLITTFATAHAVQQFVPKSAPLSPPLS